VIGFISRFAGLPTINWQQVSMGAAEYKAVVALPATVLHSTTGFTPLNPAYA
jgi:hypothetical protein